MSILDPRPIGRALFDPRRALVAARKAQAAVLYRPTGIFGRHAPFYALNLVDWARSPSLEDAVEGKVVLITGASSGIGRAAAVRLGGAGATVLLVARGEEDLRDVAAEIEDRGGSAYVHPCDLSEIEEVERLAAVALERHDHVEVLVNSAGRSIRRSVELSYDRFHDFERTMQLNYFGAVRLILALLPTMRERGSGQVINVSTTGVQARPPRFAAYTASKTALDGFSDAVAAEAAAEGVRFTKIEMPLVRTPMIEPSTGLYRSMPSLSAEQAAEWVAKAVVYRPRRIGTLVSDVAGVLNLFAPAMIEWMRAVGYRVTGETRAARAGADEAEVRIEDRSEFGKRESKETS
jgi:NAD(P)-dependent dehydrogenase (short-subunit alcohol dehydrogenase family)